MKKIKTILILVVIVLVCVVFLQNSQSVETHILFWTFTLPGAILLICTALIGFMVGLGFSFFLKKRKSGKESKGEEKPE